MKINVFKSADEVLSGLAEYFVETANQSIKGKGKFSVALSGGSSPKKLYELLASDAFKNRVDWNHVYFFFGDERNVPHTHADSNYLMAKTALFAPLNIQESHVFPVDTALSPEAAAEKYTQEILAFFGSEDLRFDLVLLGLGDNSHTASLFPYTPVLHDKTASVKSVFLQDQQVFRITLTAPLINKAFNIAYLVYGEGKAIAVHHIIEDEEDIDNYPAQLIIPEEGGDLQWFLDEPAASELSHKSA